MVSTSLIGLGTNPTRYSLAESEGRSSKELLYDVSTRFERALGAKTLKDEVEEWTGILHVLEGKNEDWSKEARGRAYGNRGNARARMGNLEEALLDYDLALNELPDAIDPRLNRGVAMEALGRLEEAQEDYESVLRVSPEDPAAWNNLGNVALARGEYRIACERYERASELSPQFAFASANAAIARYASGDEDQAMRDMRSILRRYPSFDDVRAALVAALWRRSKEGEAETQWNRVEDVRYKDIVWLKETRKWPPILVQGMEGFLQLKSQVS